MAFKATNQLPADNLVRIKRMMSTLRDVLTNANTTMAAGSVDIFFIKETVFFNLVNARNEANRIKDINGIAQFARDQENDQNYDVVTEFNSLVTHITNSINWIVTNIPTESNGFIATETWNNDGSITRRTFTSAQTAGLRTELSNVTGAIT